MNESVARISAMFLRYLYLHKRSVSRALELVFWPVMELMVWGFLSTYIASTTEGDLSRFIYYLISAVIFWDLLYRSQQGITISFIEDIWTQNILNILISPLRLWEWLVATFIYGMTKTLVITSILTLLAVLFYQFSLIDSLGFYLLPFVVNLLFFGWALGVFTSGLLIRWGHSVEALIWGVPFLIQPLSAIFYPLSTLPVWLQTISKCLPSTYVFEGMRAVVKTGTLDSYYLMMAVILNLLFFLAGSFFFSAMYASSRRTGRLGRLGMD